MRHGLQDLASHMLLRLFLCFLLWENMGCTNMPSDASTTTQSLGFSIPSPTDVGASPETAGEVLWLLSTNGECDLPCFWGIVVGATPWSEVETWMNEIGTIYYDPIFYQDGDYPAYSIPFQMSVVSSDGSRKAAFSLHVTVGNDLVQRVQFVVYEEADVLEEYFFKYSLQGVFRTLGAPNQVFLNVTPTDHTYSTYDLLVFYEEEKLALDISANNENRDVVCPQLSDSGSVVYLRLSVTNPNSNLTIQPPDWIPYTATEYWQTIEEVLGIDEQTFYQQILANRSACFDIVQTEP